MNLLKIAIVATLLCRPHHGAGWPVQIPASDIRRALGQERDRLTLFAWGESGWKEVALQVERTNERGEKLNWTPDFSLPERADFYRHAPRPIPWINGLDLFLFNDREASSCDGTCEKALVTPPLCGTPRGPAQFLARIRLPQTERTVFLAECPGAVKPPEPAVTVHLPSRTLESRTFRYVYSADNNMLFDEFLLKTPAGSTIPLLKGSEFHLYVKPKVFFPLHFTRTDITSKLIGYTASSRATTGELSFALRVLLFKVSLDLMSTVSMYEDAIEVPVVLNLPVSGSMLREGSGVYYGFRYAGKDFWNDVVTDFPRLPPPGQTVPFASQRRFELGRNGTFVLTSLHMPEAFRAMNFSPALATAPELRKWDFPAVNSDFGVFYDVTRLAKGSHRLSVWFFVGQESDAPLLRRYAAEGIRYIIEPVQDARHP